MMTSVRQPMAREARRRGASSTRFLTALVVAGLMAALVPIVTTPASAAEPLGCSSDFQIDETLPSGARWQMCWELRALAGVVLHDVTYTPPGGEAVEVLGSMNLAQIHVPYQDNVARFHDVSDYGLGTYVNNLQPEDCPGGVRLTSGSTNVLCQQVADSGYAYKSYAQQARQSTLSLFSVSAIGAYNYIIVWNFDEDGTIRPEIGATGKLQRYGGGPGTGWNVGAEPRYAVAHEHNYYWRLDFDIAGSADDRVQELATRASADRQTFTTTRLGFMTEAARRVLPGSARSWRVRDRSVTNADGHPISYELLPHTDNVFRGPAYEPFTQNEFYATRFNGCEQFASHNPTLNGTCGGDLSTFVNGGSLAGADADVVVWYGTSFHHLPRDEDENHMDVHWSGFSIVPRDLTATYPIP